jgi:hypothetical protein
VEAEIQYLRDARVRPRIDAYDPEKNVLSLVRHRVRVHDLRNAAEGPSLDREGFMLRRHHSKVADFADGRQHPVYARELELLVRELTGAPLVFVSPKMILRSMRHPRYDGGVIADRVAEVVHADRTDRSVWSEAREAMQHSGTATIPEGRLMSFNIWRALTPPPQDYPLALCDLRTVREEHLVRADSMRNPAGNGEDIEFYVALFDPAHRWCYVSDLCRDEVLVFQQYDTAASGPSGCPHTAFHDPTAGQPAAARISIEARAYALFPS